MNPININDLFQEGFTEELDKIVKSLQTLLGTVTEKIGEVRTAATKLAATPMPTTHTEETRKMATAARALSDEYKSLLQQYGIYKQTIEAVTDVERDQNQILKLQQQYADAAEGSYNKLSAEYRLLKVAMNAMGTAEEAEIKRLEIMKRRAAELYEQMNQYQKQTGKYTLQVGDYSRALNGLNLSTQQILREMPTLANSTSQFFMAISNNVPIFLDNFRRARQELGSFSAALKGTLGAIFSWQTALLVLLTVLPKIAKAIHDKKKAQQEANKETKEAFDREKELLSLEENIAKAEQKSVSELRTLYAITQDVTRSEKERTEAAEALQKLYPERLANLSQEEILAGNAKGAIDELTNSLVMQARARGYLNEIEDLSQKRAQKEIELQRLRTKEIDQQGQLELARAKAAAEGRAYVAGGTAGAAVTTTVAGAEEREAQAALDATSASINTLDSELQDLANTIDDIIKLIPTERLLETLIDGKGGKKQKTNKGEKVGEIPDYIIEYYEAVINGMEDGLTKQMLQLDKEGLELGRYYEKEWQQLQKKEAIARKNNDEAALADVSAAMEKLAQLYEQRLSNIRQKREELLSPMGADSAALTDPLAKVRAAYVAALAELQKYTQSIQDGLDAGRKIGADELADWQEVIRKKIEAEAAYQKAKKQLELQGRLDAQQITQQEYEDLLKIEYAKIDAAAGKAIDKIGRKREKRWNIWTALFGKDYKDEATGTISRVIGEDLKYALDQTMNTYKQATKFIDEYIDALARQAKQAEETANTEVDMARKVYEAELEARANGYANAVDTARMEYEQKLAMQKKAQKESERIQRIQLAMESASQAASLLTATANIIASYSKMPIIGQVLAGAGILAMWGTFIAAKSKAAEVTRYGEGMSEYLDYGGSHASGRDIDFGRAKDGHRRRVERGEVIGVINKRNVRKYGVSTVRGVIDSLNKGTFEYKYGNAFAPALIEGGTKADLHRLENGVDALVRQGEYREMRDGDKRIIQYKNLTRVIR